MDNFGRNNTDSKNLNEQVPLGGGQDTSVPFDEKTSVSHSPLNLGGGGTTQAPLNLGGGGTTQAPKLSPPKPVAKGPVPQTAPPDPSTPPTVLGTGSLKAGRITGVKTFFTKLHAGAIEFLDEQITKWLKENPSISIKLTTTTTGEIQGKKTEPNIIITVWY